MSPLMHPLWLALVIGLTVPIAGRAYWRRRRRMQELTELARRRGLNFAPQDLIGLHERYYNLALMRRGHNRYAWNILYGSTPAGLVAIFRYSFDIGFGTQRSSRQWWVAVLESPKPLVSWQVTPATEVLSPGSQRSIELGPFRVEADRAATLEILCRPEIASVFNKMSKYWHVEARGGLLAIAAPFEKGVVVPDQLCGVTIDLGRVLQAAG